MIPEIDSMLKLQGIHTKIVRAHENAAKARKDILEFNREIESNKKSMQSLEDSLKKIKADIKSLEIENEELNLKIKDLETKRLSAANEKQLTAFDNELEQLKNKNSEIEESLFEDFESQENLEKDIASKNELFGSKEKDLLENIKTFEERVVRLEEAAVNYKNEFEQAEQELPPQIKSRFVRVLQSKDNIGIVKMENGICSNCRNSIPSGDVNLILEGKSLYNCQNCGKYIYSE